MGEERQFDAIIGDEYVGMMIRLIGNISYMIYKYHGFPKILEQEFSLQLLFRQGPIGYLAREYDSLFSGQARTANATGFTGFLMKRHVHILQFARNLFQANA